MACGGLHEAAALEHNARCIGKCEDAGNVRGGNFAYAVAHHGLRRYPQGPPERRQSHLQRKERRLRELGLVKPRAVFVARQFLKQRPLCTRHGKQRIALLNFRAECRFSRQQFAPHSPPLRTLSRADEGNLAACGRVSHAKRQPRRHLALHERVQPLCHCGAAAPRHHQALVMVCAPQRRRGANVEQAVAIRRAQPRCIRLGKRAQCVFRLRREGQQQLCIFGHRRRRCGWQARRFLENDMRVGAAKTKGTDACAAWRGTPWPGSHLGGNIEARLVERNVRVEALKVKVRRNGLMLQAQDDLNQTGHARRCLEVAEVGLDGRERNGGRSGTRRAEHRSQSLDLNRVAQGRTRAVRLDAADLRRRDVCVGQRAPHHFLLREAIGCCHGGRSPILVDGRAADDRPDGVAVGKRVGEALEHHNAAAFAAHKAIGARIKGLAAAVGGHEPPLGKRNGLFGRENCVDAAGERQVAVSIAQALAGKVQGDKR